MITHPSFIVQHDKMFVYFIVHPHKLLYYYKHAGKVMEGSVELPERPGQADIDEKVRQIMSSLAI